MESEYMKIETHHIPSQGFDLTFEEQAAAFESLKQLIDSAVCDFISPIQIDLNVMPMRDLIRVKGTLETVVRQACVRCLGDFDYGLKTRFILNYSNQIPEDLHDQETQGIELTAQQIGITFYKGDEIDFSDAIQEQVVLAIPYKPICSEGCKGLCSQCGQDLNKGKCQCGEKQDDGPFEALRKLKLPSQ
jgi:uncharacterized protein